MERALSNLCYLLFFCCCCFVFVCLFLEERVFIGVSLHSFRKASSYNVLESVQKISLNLALGKL